MQVAFVVTVENLSGQPAVVQLSDRVPVSESDEVKVSSIKIQPDVKPDAKGLLKWDLNLAANQSKEFRIEYTLDYPTDLPQRAEAAKASDPASERFYRLGDQIKSLESKF